MTGPDAKWSPNRKTLDRLPGYRRARQSEVGPGAAAKSRELLRHPYGTLHPFDADGRSFIGAIEQHTNPLPGETTGRPHKGVSLFVPDVPSVTMPAIPFLQARHYTVATRRTVDLVVLHSAEIGETLDGAEALMRACARGDRRASWHFAVDADSITQSVSEYDVAWHAPGANRNGIGIELCGRARQTAAEWADLYSSRMLDLAATLVAGICSRWRIPVVFCGVEELKACARGITTHDAVAKAFGRSVHWDPGPHFPMGPFLDLVRDASEKTEPNASYPTLQRGARGSAVATLQALLNQHGAAIPKLREDGDLGAKSEAALMIFQMSRGLKPTGICDSATWSLLLAPEPPAAA